MLEPAHTHSSFSAGAWSCDTTENLADCQWSRWPFGSRRHTLLIPRGEIQSHTLFYYDGWCRHLSFCDHRWQGAFLHIQFCKGTPTCSPPVPVPATLPALEHFRQFWRSLDHFVSVGNGPREKAFTHRTCFFFFFSSSRAWEFLAVINVTTSGPRRVIVVVPLSTSPRQPLCPPRTDARNRVLEVIASDCSTYFVGLYLFWRAGMGAFHSLYRRTNTSSRRMCVNAYLRRNAQ